MAGHVLEKLITSLWLLKCFFLGIETGLKLLETKGLTISLNLMGTISVMSWKPHLCLLLKK